MQAALNVLEFLDLGVNTEKNQVVWIRKKKWCKEKLLRLYLQWETICFNMLGLSFSGDLMECTAINFSKQIREIHKIINNWNKRSLAPIGKITIVKTFLLFKLNHLLLSLPNPLHFQKINGIFYRFI